VTVIVLSACPPGLRGQLTRWLLEIAPGVFVEHVPGRVRDLLWDRIIGLVGRGRALMVYSTDGEQRLAFKVHGHHWAPEDHDGIHLMRRPPTGRKTPANGETTPGTGSGTGATGPPERWSVAARRRRFGSNALRRPTEK
jgi:CRISPR-associated protein Cas2